MDWVDSNTSYPTEEREDDMSSLGTGCSANAQVGCECSGGDYS